MKKLIAKIRAILRNRRVRKIWMRTVSSIASLVVFVTTYALVLPAITMESEAACGIEAHQHDDSCYEERLICNIPESDGHIHTEDCYSTTQKLICNLSEHLHTSDCYDEEGNLTCSQEEHQHGKDCYEEIRELICGLEESEGHHHDSSCYEKVLTCEKEVHTHSPACYREDAASVAATEHAAVAATTTISADDAAMDETANASGTFVPVETAAEGYVPTLDELDFRQLLNNYTTIYYHRPEDRTEDSGQITDWQKVDEDTVLEETDILRVYLAYTIPAGSLNETNATAKYRLPGNLHLTDEQMEAINQTENGLSGLYVDYDTLQITDTEKHSAYLGAEAVDGLRTPDQTIEDYLSGNNNAGDGEQTAQEIISAVVKTDQVYDEDGIYGKKGAYLGTDLVFTFSPYTILKNRNEYDSDGTPVKAGESVSGWFTLDFNMDQVDWKDNAAEITFVSEDIDLNTSLISESLQKADPISEESPDSNNPDDEKAFNENSSTEENKDEAVEETHPAVSFEDSLTVHTGNLSSDTEAGNLPNSSKMTVSVSAEAGTFPAGTEMVLSAVTDMDAVAEAVEGTVDSKTCGFQAVDISFRDKDGNEIEPLKPISVTMRSDSIKAATEDSSMAPVVVHVEDKSKKPADAAGELVTTVMETLPSSVDNNNSEPHGITDSSESISFKADSFSIYAIVYTVDFHWEVDGKTYDFSIPGGGFVSLEHMAEVLGIARTGADGSVDESSEESIANGVDTSTNVYEGAIKLNEVEVSEATRKFVADVESLEFSNPELVCISKVDQKATVGEIKSSHGLECEYSADLTEKQIADINNSTVEAGDWALIGVHPFTSEETLTVTMKNEDQFVVKVTDAQISTHVMTADGRDYSITVTYGPEAGIPDEAELRAEEITQEKNSEEFNSYVETAEELLATDLHEFIRIFDISIRKDGEELEPKAPVSVCIEYTEGVEVSQNSQMKVVHFASSGAEVLENHTEETEGILNKVAFETDSFSAYATISERLGDDLSAKCIAYFSFDDDNTGFTGAGARAVKEGTTQLRDGYSERALYLDGNGNLTVTKNNGSSLLSGLDEFTVSYWAYPDQSRNGEWAYFIAPNTNGQTYLSEKYLGTSHNNGTITAERYNNNGSRPASATATGSLNEWHHVAVVYKNGVTELYLDGKLADSESSSVQIRNLLGYNSVFQVGKGNWGYGEYYHGYLDEFAVFNTALSAEEVAKVCDNAYYHDAKKVSVASLRDGQNVIIYNKIWNTDTREYDYFALAGDGTLAPVYDISDTIYWRHDTSLEWKLIVYYQTQRDAYGNPVTDEHGNPVYVLDGNGKKIESGYYEFYNEATGKYLAPQAGSWSADAPFGVNLEGRQNSQYASTIESWDQSANNYYGYRYDKDGTGNVVLNTASSTENSEHRDWEFFFATTEILKEGELETVDTVSNPKGLTLKMQNFPGTGNDKDRTAYLQSVLGGTYHPGATQNILEDVIRNGWPQVSGGNGKNLGNIYNNGKTVDGLFIQSIYDETGYYEYSSFNNYAYLGNQDRFTVYKQLGTPSSDTADHRFYWKRGNFLPYNAISPDNISDNKNYYDENGSLLDKNDPRYGETLYRTVAPANLIDSTSHANDTKGIADYYFGMTIDANFMMPAGGRDDRNNPITFEFNGDDDMWVYIDGVLVLDLGGIHDARAGKIDFENGQITYAFPSENSRPTTIKGCFEQAGVLPNGDPWDANRVDEFFSGDTFKDYSTHTMNMYYMERGAGASNLHVKFNLPIVEEGKFSVEKKLEDAAGEYANKKFAYKAYKVQNVHGQDQESILNPSADANVTCVYEGSNTPVSFDADGTFYLKPGEKAVFSVGDQKVRYYVKEVGIDPDEYDVYLNNDANPTEPQNGEVSSIIDTVQNRAHLLFRNKVKNPGLLHITKKVFSPYPVTEDTKFEFYVYLENTDGEIVPYRNGKYYVTKKTETGWDYYEYVNGSLVKTADQSKPVAYEAGPYGAIGNIPDGYTIEVKNLLPGTHFLVTERLDRIPEGYSFYSKTLTADTYDDVTTEAQYSGTAPDGRIKENTAADVIVTNVSHDFGVLKDLEIKKIWKGEKPHPNEITFTVKGTVDKSDGTTEYYDVDELKSNGADKVFKLNEGNSWNTKIGHLPGLTSDGRFITYHVMENPVEGYVGQEKDVTDQITVCNLKVVRLWQEGETRPATVRVKVKNSAGEYYAGTDADGNAVFNDSGTIFDLKQSEGYEKDFDHLPMDDTYTAVEIVNGVEAAAGGLAVYRSTVVAFDIENEPIGEQVDPNENGNNPEIHKRIDALRDGTVNPDSPHTGEDLTNLYRLYLDYKINSIQEPAGVDLLFIIDHSGSMNNNAYQGNRYRARSVQNALNGENGVIAEFLKMNENNQWAAVGFNGPSGLYYSARLYGAWPPGWFLDNANAGDRDSEILSSAGTSFTRTNNGVSLPNEGDSILTNYTAGLWRAEQFLLDTGVKTDQKKKVVVFISDGIPTLHIPNLDGSLAGAGRADGSYYYPDAIGGCPDEALEEFGYFVDDMKANGYTFGENMEFYTIGFGGSMQTANGSALLQNMLAEAYDAAAYADVPEGHFMTINDIDGNGSYSNTAADKLKDDLRIITGLKESFTNIVIEDTLSEYVGLYGLAADADSAAILRAAGAKVTMTDPNDTGRTITLYSNGALTAQNNLSGGKKILEEVIYDKSTKTVKAVFADDYQALPGVTYTLSFDVKTTDAAYDKYAESGYDKVTGENGSQTEIVGDEDTDFQGTDPANTTSSGKAGFRSNDSAKASYKHDGTNEHRDYPHPVIQAFTAEIHLLKTDQEGKPLAGAKFRLYKNAYDPADTDEARAANEVNCIGDEMISVLKGTEENQIAEIAIKKLKPGTYYLIETDPPAGYNKSEPVKIEVKVKTTMNNSISQDTVEVTASIGDNPIAGDKLKHSDGVWTVKVMNTAGYELPSTGGSGTHLFTFLGSILILGAGVLLWRRERAY